MMMVPAPYGSKTKKLSREELEARIVRRLNGIESYLTEEKWEQLLESSKPKDIAIMEGIFIDKLLLLQAPSVQAITPIQHTAMNDLLVGLMKQIKERGLEAKLTERTAVITASVT